MTKPYEYLTVESKGYNIYLFFLTLGVCKTYVAKRYLGQQTIARKKRQEKKNITHTSHNEEKKYSAPS